MTIEERLPVTRDDFMPINQIFYGTASGAAGKIAEYPLDTLMVRLQAQSMGSNTSKGEHFNGILDCVRRSLKNDGFLGLYKGITIPLSACIIETSLSFLSYTYVQSLLINRKKDRAQDLGLDADDIEYSLSLPELCFSGASSGLPVSLFITPFELLKCRIQTLQDKGVISSDAVSRDSKNSRPIAMLRSALAASGFSSLYRGYTGTLIREVAGGGIWFGVYEAMARQLANLRSKDRPTKDDLTLPELFCSGACAGVACSVLVYPPDVVKCIQQTSPDRISMYNVVRRLLKYEGFRGLYRGLGVCLLRSALSSGVTIGVYVSILIFGK